MWLSELPLASPSVTAMIVAFDVVTLPRSINIAAFLRANGQRKQNISNVVIALCNAVRR